MSSAVVQSLNGEALSQELQEIFRRHCRFVYRTAYSITGNRHDAEDVLQTIFLKLLQREFPPELTDNPRAYLYRAAVNQALNSVRSRKRQKLIGDPECLEAPAPSPDVDADSDIQRRLSDAMAQLKPNDIEILILRYGHNCTDANRKDAWKIAGRRGGGIVSAPQPPQKVNECWRESMTRNHKNIEEILTRHVRVPTVEVTESDCNRVLQNLWPGADLMQEERRVDSPHLRAFRWRRLGIVFAAAALLVVAILAGGMWRRASRSIVQTNDDSATIMGAQPSQSDGLSFEVVSVRPTSPGLLPPNLDEDDPCSGYPPRLTGRRLIGPTTTVYALIALAYNPWQAFAGGCSYASTSGLISSGPDWVKSDRFTIEALIPEDTPNYSYEQLSRGEAPELQRMLQALLRERFGLVLRREMKEMPVYLLSLDQNASTAGSRMAASLSRGRGIPARWGEGIFSAYPFDQDGNRYTSIAFKNQPMARLAQRLVTAAQRLVLDRTGLSGEFDFILEYDDSGLARAPLFAALQEQLGLKLQPSRARVEVLVIERAQKPLPN